MKKRIICLLTALMMISALFFGCADSGNNANAVELPKPTGLYVTKSDNTVHWDSVENASGYKVKINGTEYEVKENYYTIENADYGKSYEIEVVAVGDGKNYRRSRTSMTKYTIPALTTEKNASYGLKYTPIKNDTEISVSKLDSVPIKDIKGKLIIPDTYMGKFVTEISDHAFIPDTKIVDAQLEPYNAFITEIVFPVKLKKIGSGAFSKQYNLESVVIPKDAEIEYFAFARCEKLRTAIINAKVIGAEAFYYCSSLSKVTLNGTLIIGDFAFSGILATTLIIPKSVIKVGKYIFSNSTENKTIYYEGTQEKWSEIAEEQSKTYVYFYSEEKPSTEGMFWHYDSNRNPVKW